MEQALTIFNFQEQETRITVIDGNPWWLAVDVCTILDVANVSQAVENLDEDEKLIYPLHISGQVRQTWLVSESGLYHLIFTSRKSEAETFRRWVTHEVLPSIRKTGRYILPGQEHIEALAEITEMRKELTRIRRTLVPPTTYHRISAPRNRIKELPDEIKRIIQKFEDQGKLGPTIRQFSQYLKAFTANEIKTTVARMTEDAILQSKGIGKATRYSLITK